MRNKVNKSFVWGVLIASLTWIISFYLFWRLSSSSPNSFLVSKRSNLFHNLSNFLPLAALLHEFLAPFAAAL